ncbi:hypothetical protein XBLMG947_4131 [Xanthomonas bromi]|uniref:DUF4123 domain-containing protein n=1 Tax=Xanthomonas bromi TaxID=56449 RepID=A0A1C3NSE5_9XANT|nr:DUF4123 domain-containing protein [Xanthomonas bromi]PPV04663.1 DUF4123 domain-containing protein [Xanthomonas bromi]SBV53307.1 hypothetical protein XBLMG947_4131 [Xanthomonas bromi]
MSEFFFANTPADDQQLARLADALMLHDAPAGRLWALIDVALVGAERFGAFRKRMKFQTYNALAESSLVAFGQHAPHFLECPEDQEALHDTIRQLYRFAGSATAVSWLWSDQSRITLQRMAGYLAKVQIEDKKAPVHCRFADTRVLPHLLQVLTPIQSLPVRDAVSAWYWLGREAGTEAWRPHDTVADGAGPAPAPLRLSIGQFRAMQVAAEPDALFSSLLDKTPELVPADDRGQFHRLIQQLLQTANALSLSTQQDRLQFVTLSFSCGNDFYEIPALQPVWNSIAQHKIGLCDSMRSWGDAIWNALEARRDRIGA